ncbi:MAG: Uncharacterized protein G01um10147_748 [Microgenomates group bacterium Gr01-1014_7]|nr:MAG: Uncharacterized protein G01um10147_748 [Microgenomates group bacterium Gr01-1014_7]
MKLNKKIPAKHFYLSQILILIVGLALLAGLYYILNIQYQKPNKPFSNGPVTTPPKTLRLDLDNPDDDFLSFQSSVIVSGQTGPLKDVLIFTDSQNLIIESKKDGSFSTVLILNEGENKVTAVVFDTTGDSRLVERTVYYSKEKL